MMRENGIRGDEIGQTLVHLECSGNEGEKRREEELSSNCLQGKTIRGRNVSKVGNQMTRRSEN